MATATNFRNRPSGSARPRHQSLLGVCIALLVLGGCSCGKERGVAEGGYGDAGSGEDTAALPELVPPALDVERALDLFRSIGEGQRPLEIPPLSEDLSQATEEVEPNDRKSEASPMGTARLARGWSERNTYDYFQFEVDGEPRQWLIEVRGASISRAEYSDLGGSRHRLGRIRGQDDVLGAANLVLQPGTHWLYVYGRDTGEYTIRLAEVGRAGEGDDREPNGNARNAAVMRVGESVSGLFYPDDDRDYYRFSLFAKATVRIRLESPVDIKPRVELSNSNGGHQLQIVRWAAREEGGGFEDTRSLLPGDYVIALGAPKSSSRLPYSLAIEAVEPGELVTDLEPNDDIESSRSLPRDGVVQGTLAGTDDFYSLPYLGVDSTLTIAGPVVGPEVGAEVGTEVGTERRESPGAAVTEPVAPVRETPRDIRIYAQPGDKKFVRAAKNPATGLLEVDLPAGSNPHLQLIGSKPYRLELSFDPPLVAREDAELPPIDVKLSAANRRFAAFVDRFQETRLQVAVANRGDRPVEMDLELTSDHFAWRPTLRTTKLALEPGEVQAVEGILEVAPDVWSTQPVRLALQATVSGTTVAGDSLLVFAECGAIAVAPSAKSLLPPALEGGLNVAAQGLGGRLLSEDKRAHARVAGANNGFTYIDEGPGFPLEKGVGDLTVALAGGESVPVVGVLLNPMSTRSTARWLRDFELHLSEDGETFSRALSGTLDRSPREQGFALASPIPARFARLHVLSTYGEGESWGTLGEFKVVAEPGWDLTGGEGFDLASPELGGHVVRTSWRAHFYNHVKAILTNEEEGRSARVDPDNPTEWVIGFHHNRSALIDALEWIDQKEGRSQSFDRVQVAVSTDGPLGPWQPVGTWDLSDDATSARIWELEQSVWARFVRFSNFDADKVGNWALPETLRVRERPSGPDYRSILTEWGEYSREAFYETTMERTASAPAADDDNDSRESADRLHLDRPLAGVVTLGDDEDWYRIDLPADANTLDLEISGDPRLKAVVELADETGSALDWDQETVLAGSAQMSALLGGGRTVFVRVSEPPRSIAFAWDNSGSMGSYLNTIYPAMARFVGEVKPGLEFANLHPFGGTLFLDDWSDDPTALRYAVENYHRRDNSSSAEPALGLVADELAERQGTRAVVFLTDAKTPSQSRSVEMWSSLGRSKPSVFALHLHTSSDPGPQDLMQDWSNANGGHYEFFRTLNDLDAGFQRAACYIRRPAAYEMTARARFEEPLGPGFLAVEAPEVPPDYAVELILDASGSMLQRIGGKTRIAVARDVLNSLVDETIPEGAPVALRVFGHRKPDACDTELVVPLAPLDRPRISRIIRATEAKNLARTPIGESLAMVAQDLRSATGPKLVVLITDGEETCDGDPAAATRALKEAGIDARLSVIGFAIDDAALKSEFESWARLGGGLYFDTADEEELGEALEAALKPKFQVLDGAGEIAAEGTTGGDAIAVPMGLYDVKILTSPVRFIPGVRVEPDKTRVVAIEEGT